MKIRTMFSLAGFLLLFCLGAFLLLRFNPFSWELPEFSIIRTEKVSARDTLLTDARTVYRLNTVELVYKSVFPYDYLPENPDWQSLFYNEAVGELGPGEKELIEFYRFCRSLNIDPVSKEHAFAVVTVIVKAGFDLSDYPLSDSIITERKRVQFTLPYPVVTGIIIHDPSETDYPYPGLEISPENWKRLTEFIKTGVDSIVAETRLLEKAAVKGEELFSRMAAPGGFTDICFNYLE